MGTYIYSGLHPRKGTIPVHTFFPSLGGKPVVAMKSSIIIEGQSLQKVKLKEVKAIMSAYEQFLIPTIYETHQEYDYAILVENLDNDSLPDKAANCSSKPGESYMGIIIDQNPWDETYTVACGPLVFTNVASNFTCRSLKSEFPCVQIQRSSDDCDSSANICNNEAEIKKLLDSTATTGSQVCLPSPLHSAKLQKGHITSSLAAMPQAQTNTVKSSTLKPSITSASSSSIKSQGEGNLKSSSSSCLPSLKSSLQQNKPTKSTPFKPFTGWSSSLRNKSPIPAQSNLLETYGGSSSSLSYESLEDSWNFPALVEPVNSFADTPFSEILRMEAQRSTTNSSNTKTSTSSGISLSCRSLYPQAQTNSTKSSNLSLTVRSATSLRSESPEDSWDIPASSEPFVRSANSFVESIHEQAQTSTVKSSQLEPSVTSASSLFLKALYPQTQSNYTKNINLKPSTTSASSSVLESLNPQAQANFTKSSNIIPSTSSTSSSSYLSINSKMQSSQLNPSTSSASSSWYESLYPRAQNSQLNPFTTSASSLRSEFLTPQVQSSQLNSSVSSTSSQYESFTPLAHSRCQRPSTSTASSVKYVSLLPQATYNPTLKHTTPSVVLATENESAIQDTASACSLMPLNDFEELKPTLSSFEKKNKIIEDSTMVTICPDDFEALRPTLSSLEKRNYYKVIEDLMTVTI